MLCEVCNLEEAVFIEHGTGRRLCSVRCQQFQLPSTKDALILLMMQMNPNRLAKMCLLDKRIWVLSRTAEFKKNYAIEWIRNWTRLLSQWIYDDNSTPIRQWLPVLLQLEQWVCDRQLLLCTAAEHGSVEAVSILLGDNRVDPTFGNHQAFELAISGNHIEVVRVLLADPRVDPTVDNNALFVFAVEKNHVDIARILLLANPMVDPGTQGQVCIYTSCESGFDSMVALLLTDDRVDVADDDNMPFVLAAENGHVDVVVRLLQHPQVNPAARYNLALVEAAHSGHGDVFRVLMADNRVRDVFNNLPLDILLHRAILGNCEEIVDMVLADARADPLQNDYHLIECSVRDNLLNSLRRLMRDPRVRTPECYQMALNLAVRSATRETIQLLLENQIGNVDFDFVVDIAMNHRPWNVCQLVLKYAPPGCPVINRLMVHYAGLRKFKKVEWLVYEAGADPSSENDRAVIYAALFGQFLLAVRLARDPRVNFENVFINGAIAGGHMVIVERFLHWHDQRVLTKDLLFRALQMAVSPREFSVYHNANAIAMRLLRDKTFDIDPSANDNEILKQIIRRDDDGSRNLLRQLLDDDRVWRADPYIIDTLIHISTNPRQIAFLREFTGQDMEIMESERKKGKK